MIERLQEKVQHITSVTGPSGAVTAGAGVLTFNEWLTLGGFALALGSFLINWYYQHKRYVLERDKYKP